MTPPSSTDSAPGLHRGLGVVQATALNIANMVGIGPFITIPLFLKAMGGPQALVAWVIAAAMRIAQGSATVAIITAAGIVAPIVKGIPGYSPNLIMLALCCGGSGFSHVSDSGFWLVNQYFGQTVSQTLRSWTAMKVIESVIGLGIVLAMQALMR